MSMSKIFNWFWGCVITAYIVWVIALFLHYGGLTGYRHGMGIIRNANSDCYTVEDKGGNLWDFYADPNDFVEGQVVWLTFDTNGTESIYDDRISKVK